MAYILTPRFAPAYQAPQCSPFGFCAPRSQPTYGYRTVQLPQSQSQPRSSPFASFFSQLDNLVNEIDRESQREAQIEAQREAQRAAHVEAQRAAQIKAQREAYQAHIEAQRVAYRQRQAQIAAHIEAQREAHRQRQLRRLVPRAKFAVTQDEQGWKVDAEVSGFEQENINIEVTDENTLKIAGNTEWGAKPQTETQQEVEVTPVVNPSAEDPNEQIAEDKMEGITLEPEVEAAATGIETTETESIRPATPDSDTASHRSYQPTVEDDFEDLGPEASTLFSTPSAPATPAEPKGKEKAVEPSVETREIAEDPKVSVPTEASVTQQPQPEAPAQQQQQEERRHGSFERTLRFPERIDASNVRASFKEGVLSISVPRAQVQQVRRIAIL
ncbi:hypothetical protein EKO04_008406 [Ascochyta lentis]|uniref:SHSP domain-containing protein n=1 Tax=Ascochyta lentis TaxID=205686 RepID=A0A8H7J131_9PLEO|nr:hypothetical protein EKO04_008406 [Ascochyta lentis]